MALHYVPRPQRPLTPMVPEFGSSGTEPPARQDLEVILADEIDPITGDVTNNRVRIRKGYISVTGGFIADPGMDPFEDGTDDHPYFYLGGLADMEAIYVKLTVSYSGLAWRIDSSVIEHGIIDDDSPAPQNDATTIHIPLRQVRVNTDTGATSFAGDGDQGYQGTVSFKRQGTDTDTVWIDYILVLA